MGSKFATSTLTQILDFNRDAIKEGEPVIVGDFKLGLFDLANGRLYNAYTIQIITKVQVQCSKETIFLRIPIFLDQPQILFDLKLLSNVDAGELLLYYDQVYANMSVAIPRPPKKPEAKTKVLKFQFIGTPGLGFRSPSKGPVSAALSTALNVAARTFKWPIERLVEFITEDLVIRYVQNNYLPL